MGWQDILQDNSSCVAAYPMFLKKLWGWQDILQLGVLWYLSKQCSHIATVFKTCFGLAGYFAVKLKLGMNSSLVYLTNSWLLVLSPCLKRVSVRAIPFNIHTPLLTNSVKIYPLRKKRSKCRHNTPLRNYASVNSSCAHPPPGLTPGH